MLYVQLDSNGIGDGRIMYHGSLDDINQMLSAIIIKLKQKTSDNKKSLYWNPSVQAMIYQLNNTGMTCIFYKDEQRCTN